MLGKWPLRKASSALVGQAMLLNRDIWSLPSNAVCLKVQCCIVYKHLHTYMFEAPCSYTYMQM